MNLKLISIVSCVVWLQGTNGASFSKVYVQSGGPDVVPVEYINYGAPTVLAEPQIAQLSAAPLGSLVSSVIPPCVSPCIVSGQNIAPVAALPSAKYIAYNSPNVPVVVAPSKDNGYEYSYVVYDENTGDRKAQREFSDGSVVRGEYSFIQPDGYVREVQYRADDLTGFNVVVKKILPESVGVIEKKKDDLPPCKEVKSEALKEEPQLELAEVASTDDHSHDNHDPNHEGHELHHVEHDNNNPSHEHAEPSNETPAQEEPAEEHAAEPEQEHASEPEHAPEPEHAAEEHGSEAENAPEPEHAPEPEQHEEPAPEALEESHEVPEEAHEEQPKSDEVSHEETHEEPSHEEAPEETHEAIVVQEEPAPEVVVSALPVPVPQIPATNLVVSYDDIIRCVQSKAQSQQGLNISPLTYIILPAANRPC